MKSLFLYLCKYSGLFLLSNYLLRKKLLILCYHGFEINNESQFRPQLFIKKDTFERRLLLLNKKPLCIVSLDQAVQALENDNLPDNSVVITIDDGFYSVFSIAFPLLRQYDFPATLYLTTMDIQKGQPIPRLLVDYMVETTTKNLVNTSQYTWGNKELIDLTQPQDKKLFIDSCLFNIERLESHEGLEQFYNELGNVLDIDYKDVRDKRLLSLLSESEVSMLASKGLDIQLHTHTHHFPQDDAETASWEIKKNQQILEKLTNKKLVHFCYPSGQWRTLHWPLLKKEGIKSAATCLSGLNDSNVNLLLLNRFLDGESIPDIVFEAELYRFSELIRIIKNKLSRSSIASVNI